MDGSHIGENGLVWPSDSPMTGVIVMALLPIALLIGLGNVLRRFSFLADSFWPQAERLGYYVLIPALFLDGLATAHLDGVPVAPLAITLVLSTLATAAVLVAVRPFLRLEDAVFTSVFQGGVRMNNFVGVTAMVGLFGTQGIALATVAGAAIIPTVNVLVVLVFARFGTAGKATVLGVVRQIIFNPLVLGCLGGIGLQVTGLGLSPRVEPVFRSLGQASLPLGLICVGAALDLRLARNRIWPVLAASVVKFALMPLVTASIIARVGLHGPAAATAILFQVLPTAASSYIVARQFGGDASLMATIIGAQTILAAAVIPLVLGVLLAPGG